MRNFKLTLAYDGTEFHGWQIQPGRQTIQGAVAAVAEKLFGCHTVVHGAGRTDAGVHALGQVASFHANTRLDPAELQRAFNALLPPAIRVLDAGEVDLRFHARWEALAKVYQYRIFRGRVLGPFDRLYALHCPFPLDEAKMDEAARLFEGEHDFTSFTASPGADSGDGGANPRRQLFRSELVLRPARGLDPPATTCAGLPVGPVGGERSNELVYVVRGKSFLRQMVRKIVGTLLDVGRGRLPIDQVRELFEVHDRSRSGAAVPPHGLYLVSVEYAEPWRIEVP
jgi:tRNA pseudouridine38-40 synthase